MAGKKGKKNASPSKNPSKPIQNPVKQNTLGDEVKIENKKQQPQEPVVKAKKPTGDSFSKVEKKSMFRQIIDKYLLGYNIMQLIMWCTILVFYFICVFYPMKYDINFILSGLSKLITLVDIAHLFMSLEIIHSITGIVRSKFFTNLIQVASRIFLTHFTMPVLLDSVKSSKTSDINTYKDFFLKHFAMPTILNKTKDVNVNLPSKSLSQMGIEYKIPESIKVPFPYNQAFTKTFITSSISYCIIAWSLAEIFKYNYHIRKSLKVNWNKSVGVLFKKTDKDGICYITSWLRYSGFIILYPIGVLFGEIPCIVLSLTAEGKRHKYYNLVCLLILLTYIPGFPMLYSHMAKQRRAWKNNGKKCMGEKCKMGRSTQKTENKTQHTKP